jgi:hypothetical protein
LLAFGHWLSFHARVLLHAWLNRVLLLDAAHRLLHHGAHRLLHHAAHRLLLDAAHRLLHHAAHRLLHHAARWLLHHAAHRLLHHAAHRLLHSHAAHWLLHSHAAHRLEAHTATHWLHSHTAAHWLHSHTAAHRLHSTHHRLHRETLLLVRLGTVLVFLLLVVIVVKCGVIVDRDDVAVLILVVDVDEGRCREYRKSPAVPADPANGAKDTDYENSNDNAGNDTRERTIVSAGGAVVPVGAVKAIGVIR